MISLAALIESGIRPTQARLFVTPLLLTFARYDMNTVVRQAAFVAQCAHESALFTALEENLSYSSPERIVKVFKGSVHSIADAMPLVRNPKALANRVYANRNGNGDEKSGDGWQFRGRGLIQLTGRTNYFRASLDTGRPYVEQPDLLGSPADAALSAGWFWASRNLNVDADASNTDKITRAVNGPAMAGAAERRQLFENVLRALTHN